MFGSPNKCWDINKLKLKTAVSCTFPSKSSPKMTPPFELTQLLNATFFSQRCWWKFTSSGILILVDWQKGTNVSKVLRYLETWLRIYFSTWHNISKNLINQNHWSFKSIVNNPRTNELTDFRYRKCCHGTVRQKACVPRCTLCSRNVAHPV